MKLFQINTTVNTGSTGRITEEIGQKFIEQDHESFIAFGRKSSNPSRSNLIQIGGPADMYWHGFMTRAFDLHGFASKRATRNLISELERIKPDVIGLHNLHGYYLNIDILFDYLKRADIPVVWTLFDCWAFTGHCSYFDSIGCEKWKTHCNNCPQKKSYPASYGLDNSEYNFERKREIFNGVKNMTIVTHSYWLSGLVQKSFLGDYAIKVIRSGVNIDTFSIKEGKKPGILQNCNKKIVLGVANNWNKRKGLNDFIALGERLDKESHQIVLIGLNKNQMDRLHGHMIGIQRTENVDELAEYYSCADVFVNPTHEDNFPTTNLEALACGTPVVTYQTGGSPEAVDHSTGRVVEKGNVDQLYEAVLDITKDNNQDYQKNCRNRAVNEFNKEDRFKDYLLLFENELRRYQTKDQADNPIIHQGAD